MLALRKPLQFMRSASRRGKEDEAKLNNRRVSSKRISPLITRHCLPAQDRRHTRPSRPDVQPPDIKTSRHQDLPTSENAPSEVAASETPTSAGSATGPAGACRTTWPAAGACAA